MISSFRIDIKGKDSSYVCEANDTILRSALRAGVGFPYECNSGGCGSCKFELLEGEVDTLWEDAPGLSSRDITKGRKLACQSVPKEDCVVKVRTNGDFPEASRPSSFSATLTKVNELTDDMAEFCFVSEMGAQFLPGQYCLLNIPGVIGMRAYSMSNLPNNRGEWQFIVKKITDGSATLKMFEDFQIGDKVEIDGPYGHAYLQTDNSRDIVCIGGGSGLSPLLSITRAAVRTPEFNDKNIYLFYGGRGPSDICTPKLVANEKELSDRLICLNAISEPVLNAQGVWGGAICMIHELVIKELGLTIPKHEFYFCGPPAMTDTVARMLVMDYKVPHEQVHYDRFY